MNWRDITLILLLLIALAAVMTLFAPLLPRENVLQDEPSPAHQVKLPRASIYGDDDQPLECCSLR